MKNQSEKMSSFYSQELIDLVTLAAVDSNEWRKLLDKAEGAGKVEGAKTLGTDATNIWHTLSDKIAGVAPIAAALDAPVTSFLLVDFQSKVDTAFAEFDKAESALSEGGEHSAIEACYNLRHIYLANRRTFEALTDFRLLCGVVNAGIKAAQKNATDLARQTQCMAQKGAMAQKARDRICKLIKYDLEKYGLAVNLQKVQSTVIDVKEPHVDTDAEKAEKAIISAFKLDPTAAIGALLKLEHTTMASIRNAIERAQKAAQIETAKQDAEHKQGAAEDIANKVPDNGKDNPETGRPNVADMVSALNATEQSEQAAQHLANVANA